jgi:hypothetical protein
VARAAEPPTYDKIKSQVAKQPSQLQSLYIEVTSENKLAVDPKVYLTLPGHQDVILTKEEEHYAFKGDKRYRRKQCPPVVKSPWPRKPPEVDPKASPVEQARQKLLKEQYDRQSRVPGKAESGPPDEWRLMPDESFACNGKLQWHRAVLQKGKTSTLFLYGPDRSMHWGQPSYYLTCIGWSVPDPTEGGDGSAPSQQVSYLPSLFAAEPYTVAKELALVDGARCAVLHVNRDVKNTVGNVSEVLKLDDTVWLDVDHALAVKQREHAMGKDHITRTVNDDFVEILPGLWFPKSVKVQQLVPPSGPEEYRGKPMRVYDMKLTKWIVNQVPDDLFDVVPRPAKDEQVHDMRVPGVPR